MRPIRCSRRMSDHGMSQFIRTCAVCRSMPSLPASVDTRIWKSRRANASRTASRTATCGESAGSESSDEPVGGIGVFREHDRLLAVARLDAVGAKAGEDKRVPLRHREPWVLEERLKSSEQAIDLLALLLRCPRR